MSRNLRIQYEGAVFHIISRGNKGDAIFREDRTKDYFIRLLEEGSSRFHIDVYAFCVMGTHYHLLIQINMLNLSDFMHFLGSSYANYLVRNGWFGHVFSGRYKSILVEREEYLVVVSRYIHLNPVSAFLVERPEGYRWSSYPLYLQDKRKAGWLYQDWLAEYFGPGSRESIQRYREFVESGMIDPSYYPHDKIIANAVLGSREFIAGLRSKIKHGGKESEWLQVLQGREFNPMSLEGLNSGFCAYAGLPDIRIDGCRKDKDLNYAKDLFIYMAKQYTPSSGTEIAEFLRAGSANSISRRYSRMRNRLEADADTRARVFCDVEKILGRLGVSPKCAAGIGTVPGLTPESATRSDIR